GFLLPGLIIIALLITALFLNYPKLLPRLPLAGRILEARQMLNFTELSLPLSCGVPILTALDLVRGLCAASPVLGSKEMAANLKKARQRVKKGATLSESLQGKLPAVAAGAIATGEETGRLDEALEKLAEYYQRELAESIGQLKGILVPVSIVAMGGVVGLLGYGAIATLINSLPD
ncbi:MAG: type II secretion system F family protein, partial [Cyanobacteriota bacterium]|nr:type II secretion system F family protein [Cyanobacteriota bacterium]